MVRRRKLRRLEPGLREHEPAVVGHVLAERAARRLEVAQQPLLPLLLLVRRRRRRVTVGVAIAAVAVCVGVRGVWVCVYVNAP